MNTGNFFRVDRRAWAAVCELGMNPAVAYLVLAQGTDGNNRSTNWSVTSLKTYVGMSWQRGKPAIEGLIEQGFLRHAKTHTLARPRYELPRWEEILSARAASLQVEGGYSWEVLERIKVGKQPTSQAARNVAEQLEKWGLIQKSEDGKYQDLLLPDSDPSAEYIWLPNTLVTGTDRGEEPPVRRLRGAGDIWTLRLLIDLYHAQNLRDDGGISHRIVRQQYTRKLTGGQGIFKVWAFKQSNLSLWWKRPFAAHRFRPRVEGAENHPVWENIEQLQRCGLLTFVPHLWEGDSGEAEVIHPYGIEGVGGEPIEIELGEAANQAGLRLALESNVLRDQSEGYSWIAPVKISFPEVQLIGVGRLTYRPHTKRTSEWFAELIERGSRWKAFYQELTDLGTRPNAARAGA